MGAKRLLLTSPSPSYVKIAKEEGFYLVTILDKSCLNETSINEIVFFSDEIYIVDFNSMEKVDSLISWIHSNDPIDFMFHLGLDKHMEMTYEIAGKYGLNLNPVESIKIMNNKFKTRKFLNENNISSVEYIETPIKNIDDKAKQFDFPFILKPTSLSGSRGVLLCEKEKDISQWKGYMEKYEYDGNVLIEEYLVGQEVSVETLSYKGEHHVIGITDKIKTTPPYFVELGHVFPSTLNDVIKKEVEELVLVVLSSLDYQYGPVHTEVIITEKGPKIVELNTRLAGDNIPFLVQCSTGLSLQEMIIKMFNEEEPSTSIPSKVMKIHFFKWNKGKVKSIFGIEKVRELPSVKKIDLNFEVNMEIGDVYDSSRRHGFVIVSGDNINEINKEIIEIERMISIAYY